MVLPGETVATGASDKCLDCQKQLKPRVLFSPAGYYVGYLCDSHGPHSRESGYYGSSEEAQTALDEGTYSR
jgi:hypothetical protein